MFENYGGLIFRTPSAAASLSQGAVIVDDADPRLIWSEGWDPVLVRTKRTHQIVFSRISRIWLLYLAVAAVGDILRELNAPHTESWIVCHAQVQRHCCLVLLRHEPQSREDEYHYRRSI